MVTKIQQDLETNIESILTCKTITKEQVNKIKAIKNKSKSTRHANLAKTKTMIGQGHKIYLDNKDINYINSIKDLVDKGNITLEQAEKIIINKIYLCQVKWLVIYFKNLFQQN